VTEPAALPDDAALAARARAGDYDAFEALVTRHERAVYSIALRIVRRPEEAEDVVQNVFLSALRALSALRDDEAFAGWLRRIAVNTALKALRRLRRHRALPLDVPSADSDEEMPRPEAVGPWQDEPYQLMERKDLRRLLDEALATINEKHRLVFLLRDVEGLSIQETAEALGISPANVKVRLLRARLALREKLAVHFGGDARRARHDHAGRAPDAAPAIPSAEDSSDV